MKRLVGFCLALVSIFSATMVFAQAGGHASVGLGHGEEGYLHLQEMVKHLEFSLQMPDASPELKMHGGMALQHAREALKHYDEAIKHASESLGRPVRSRMGEGSDEGSRQEGSQHDEGSPMGRPGPGPMREGS